MLPGQLEFPGTEREPLRVTLARKIAAPLRPIVEQKPPCGLFSDRAAEPELFEQRAVKATSPK